MNKKVLLRERKRHTARRVVNTPSVVLTGYPPSWLGLGGGTLPGGTLLEGTLPYPTPGRVPPILAWGGTLPGVPYLGTPCPALEGYPAGGYPTLHYLGTPQQGTPSRVPPILTWHGTPPAGPGWVPT